MTIFFLIIDKIMTNFWLLLIITGIWYLNSTHNNDKSWESVKFLLLLVINTIMVVIIILIKFKLFESFGHTYFLNPTKLNTFLSSVMYLYSFMYNGVIESDFNLREMVVAYHNNYSCHPVVITTSKPFDLQ